MEGQPEVGTLRRETLEECGGTTGDHSGGAELGGGRRVGVSWRKGALGNVGEGAIPKEEDVPGEGSPREGLTSSILVHHAQPLCLVLSLKGIEIQDAGRKKREMGADGLRPLPRSSRAPQPLPPPTSPTPVWAESHGKACMS